MRKLVLLLVLPVAGCGLLPDNTLDYQKAKVLPPLQLTDAQDSRPIQPLYPIPDVTVPTEKQAVVTEGKGRRQHFAAPAPKPLTVAADSGQQPVSGVSKPVILTDGNGHPVMQTSGDMLQAWDRLAAALKVANIKVTDRNQSLGLYFVELADNGKKTAYQLKLTRTNNDNVISLQKDDDTVADAGLSQTVFDSLLKNWPE